MQTKPEFRRTKRFDHQSIIRIEDGKSLSPNFALTYNLSEAGMSIKSLSELYAGSHIIIALDDYKFGKKSIPAKVAWSKRLQNKTAFSFAVGLEFLQRVSHFTVKTSSAHASPTIASNENHAEAEIEMEAHLSGQRSSFSGQ